MVIIFDNFDETTSRNAGPECIKQSTLIINDLYLILYSKRQNHALSIYIIYFIVRLESSISKLSTGSQVSSIYSYNVRTGVFINRWIPAPQRFAPLLFIY